MATALTTKDIPGWEAEKAEKKTKRDRAAARKTSFEGQTFEDLNAPQKDALLKAIAVQLGLIEDSDDS